MKLELNTNIKLKKNKTIACSEYGEYEIPKALYIWERWMSQEPSFMKELIESTLEWEKENNFPIPDTAPVKGMNWSDFFATVRPSPENDDRTVRRIMSGEILYKLENQIPQHYLFCANKYKGEDKSDLYGSHSRSLGKILEILKVIEIYDNFKESGHRQISQVSLAVYEEKETTKDVSHIRLLTLQDSSLNSMPISEQNRINSKRELDDKELQECMKHPYALMQNVRKDLFQRLGYKQNVIEIFIDRPELGELLKTMVSCTHTGRGDKGVLHSDVMYPLLTDAFTYTEEGFPKREPSDAVLSAVLRSAVKYQVAAGISPKAISQVIKDFTSSKLEDLRRTEQPLVRDVIRMCTGESPKSEAARSQSKAETPAAAAGRLLMRAFEEFMERKLDMYTEDGE